MFHFYIYIYNFKVIYYNFYNKFLYQNLKIFFQQYVMTFTPFIVN